MLAAHTSQRAPQPLLGIGDDAAVWSPTPGRLALETTDLLIEDVHFSFDWCSWHDLGWKAMAVNISDIAAMGGRPRAAFVSVGLRASTKTEDARQLYEGLAACAAEYDLAILGGDTVTSPHAVVVSVALYGETMSDANEVLQRGSAQVGDAVAVSGSLGAAAAFLRTRSDEPRHAQVHPIPRVALGQDLVQAGIRCAMDISDGLLADLGKLCQASSVGAVVEMDRVPIAAAVQRLMPAAAAELALTGGEDYELLACGAEEILVGQGMSVVGKITQGSGVRVVRADGQELTFGTSGYDAFR